MHKSTHKIGYGALLAALLAFAGCGGSDSKPPPATVTVVSSRADMVSGNSALVRVDVPRSNASSKITLGGIDITSQFTQSAPGVLIGLVSGLQVGMNTLNVNVGGTSSPLTLVNHGANGPIFSGPHQEPWMCQTSDFTLPDGTNLGAPVDANCNAPTKIVYVYMPTTGTFKVMPSATALPADVRKTTTSDGRTVNYIVRLETGVLNRGIYQFATLFDPTTESAPSPVATYKGWNRKVVFAFGGNAAAGYRQGTFTGGVLDGGMLSQGYSVVSSTLNVLGNNANDVLSAETASMVKEKFIKTFGIPVYTMGYGGSGGSMQQYLIASNYPGILDGIIPTVSFPDLISVVLPATDCSLLSHAFGLSTATWTDAQKTAVAGFDTYQDCTGAGPMGSIGWEAYFSPDWMLATRTGRPIVFNAFVGGLVDPNNCPAVVPDALVYNAVTNRSGARCDLYSNQVNLFGVDPATGFAARAWDNVGVQYGLKAFTAGGISAEQFVQLNELAGGYDGDGNFQAQRTTASAAALATAYGYGRINQMQNLASVAIIDWRLNSASVVDVHSEFWSLASRARLEKATGSSANQVIVVTDGIASLGTYEVTMLKSMDQWLTSVMSDTRDYPGLSAKIVANKPSTLIEGCYAPDNKFIAEAITPDNASQCGSIYPVNSNPRMVAGESIANDVVKCVLTPLDRAQYPGISDAQFARLSAVFATGVCDYSQPGVGQTPLTSTWLNYTAPGTAEPL